MHTHAHTSHNQNRIQIKRSNASIYIRYILWPGLAARQCSLRLAFRCIRGARANPLQESTEKTRARANVVAGGERAHVGRHTLGLSKWRRIYDCTLRPLVNNTTTTTTTVTTTPIRVRSIYAECAARSLARACAPACAPQPIQ